MIEGSFGRAAKGMVGWTPPIPELGSERSRLLLDHALSHAQKEMPGIQEAWLNYDCTRVVLKLSFWAGIFHRRKAVDTVQRAIGPWIPEDQAEDVTICLAAPWWLRCQW